MNKTDLVTAVAEAAGLSKAKAGQCLESLLDIIQITLAQGDTVNLTGFVNGNRILTHPMPKNVKVNLTHP